MKGRGLGEHHRCSSSSEHEIAIVGLDYFFITPVGMHLRSEKSEYFSFEESPDGEAALTKAIEDQHTIPLFSS